MLSPANLREWLARDLPAGTKLLLVLASLDQPKPLAALLEHAVANGFRLKSSANPSMVLRRLGAFAFRTAEGWEITPSGRQHLTTLGVQTASTPAHAVASDLRAHLLQVANSETRSFVAEAIGCLEAGYYRAAVIMSWLASVDILQKHVVQHHLAEFNLEAKRVDTRWKKAVTADDLGRMKEADFIERLAALSILGKNVKEQLKARLDLRNACGHPNSLKISHNTAASHVEVLLLNVLQRF